jgi:hypothetical protein
MIRAILFKLVVALACVSAVAPVSAQTGRSYRAIDWVNTRWSGYDDCSQVVFTLLADGWIYDGTTIRGKWKAEGQVLLVMWDASTQPTFRMKRVGDFTIADPASWEPGSQWERCAEAVDVPFIPTWWIENTVWSGFGDCRLTMSLAADRSVAMSNGNRGTWRVDNSVLKLLIGSGATESSFVRLGNGLVSESGRGGLTRCS